MSRPQLHLPLRSADWLLEVVAVAGLVAFIGLVAANYSGLPEQIPHHFNLKGEPDAYGSKKMLWWLVGLGVGLYVLLTVIKRYPNTFNYSQKSTSENIAHQYTMATRMIRVVKAIISWGFFYIAWSTIQIAFGKQEGTGMWFLIVFLGLLFGTIIYFLYKSRNQTI